MFPTFFYPFNPVLAFVSTRLRLAVAEQSLKPDTGIAYLRFLSHVEGRQVQTNKIWELPTLGPNGTPATRQLPDMNKH